MKRIFVESKSFQVFVDAVRDSELVPEVGAVIQGTGGIRKMRIAVVIEFCIWVWLIARKLSYC